MLQKQPLGAASGSQKAQALWSKGFAPYVLKNI
jgi:hypothetical protein